MAASGKGDDGFIALWPTVVMRRMLPGHEKANVALTHLVEELDRSRADLTTDYLGDNLLASDNPAVEWLKQCINVSVRDYFKHLGMTYDIRWHLHGWANVNRFGDYHDYHNHPRAYLSGTYYVKMPAAQEKLSIRRDLRPGSITLYDPRGAVNMTAIKGDPYVEPEYTVLPEPGMILMWPSFVNHFVHPNLSKEHRISISYNVMLNWSDDYLPAQ
ncbi:MAG: TIGR02466 family protein [Gammaproteobacteria bacterium]|nr:TIGR02466 family protein [Gammaproteobacteria bacterium]